MSDVERWLPIAGYEGSYEVSDLGRVRSLDRTTSHGRKLRGTLLRPLSQGRYLTVGLHLGGHARVCLIHRLVLGTFVGAAPTGHETRHLDGDPHNNRLFNLAWGTSAENKRDQLRHGTNRNTRKTECPQGHPYGGDNLRVDRLGNRRCVICRRQSFRRANARRSAKRKAA